MRKFNFLLLVLAWGLQGRTQFLGTKTPYIPEGHSYTAAPAGYRPVFINYVGRHGARFLTKAGADIEVLGALDGGAMLTDKGKQIRQAAELLRDASKGKYEHISLLGADEQQAIGQRMRAGYPTVFSGRGIDVVTTFKSRTKESAEAFLRGLDYGGKKEMLQQPEGKDTVLRFYDLSPEYLRYKKSEFLKRPLDSLDQDPRTSHTALKVCRRIFTADYVRSMPAADAVAFTDHLYDLYSVAFAMTKEVPGKAALLALGAAFDSKDLAWLSFRDGAADFLGKGPGYDSLGIQVTVAAPLLQDFITSTDRATSGRDAVLRFTHAEAIAPFAALLGIRGASEPVRSIFGYGRKWQAGKVIPLSANIEWVVYANGTGEDLLVKVLLNEAEVHLPVSTTHWPYYKWLDLKEYYVKKLQSIAVRPGEF